MDSVVASCLNPFLQYCRNQNLGGSIYFYNTYIYIYIISGQGFALSNGVQDEL
jgi:hypothetical protein